MTHAASSIHAQKFDVICVTIVYVQNSSCCTPYVQMRVQVSTIASCACKARLRQPSLVCMATPAECAGMLVTAVLATSGPVSEHLYKGAVNPIAPL